MTQSHFGQSERPAGRRADHLGARSGDPGARHAAGIPGIRTLLAHSGHQVRQEGDAQQQLADRPLSRRRRHEDRLHLRLRLQPGRHRHAQRQAADRGRARLAVVRRCAAPRPRTCSSAASTATALSLAHAVARHRRLAAADQRRRRPTCARRCAASIASVRPPKTPTTSRRRRPRSLGRSRLGDRVHALEPAAGHRQDLAADRPARPGANPIVVYAGPPSSPPKPRSPRPAPRSTPSSAARRSPTPKSVTAAAPAAAPRPDRRNAGSRAARRAGPPRPARLPQPPSGQFGPPPGQFTPPGSRALPAVDAHTAPVDELRARGACRAHGARAADRRCRLRSTAAVPMPRPRPKSPQRRPPHAATRSPAAPAAQRRRFRRSATVPRVATTYRRPASLGRACHDPATLRCWPRALRRPQQGADMGFLEQLKGDSSSCAARCARCG